MSGLEHFRLTVDEAALVAAALRMAISRHESQARYHGERMLRVATASRHEQTAEAMRRLLQRLKCRNSI
jgi:hypothetical protein